MMAKTKIEWAEESWNPTTGCSKISAGCANCYAERMAFRLEKMGNPKYNKGFQVTIHPESLEDPYHWLKPRRVFVNSMSDLFHEDIPLSFIEKVFRVMNENPNHIFQVLTKRSDILKKYAKNLTWTKNIWMGVTVEDKQQLHRIDDLRYVNAAVRFISCEPLLSDLSSIDLATIGWVIVGGESGPNARPMEKSWVENIFHQCRNQNVPFFFKQWGGVNKKKTGRLLHGKIYSEMPTRY
jgi:protein gp37